VRLIFHITRSTLFLLLVGLVLLALALSVARSMLPQIEEYKLEVVSQLGQFIGNPVRVGKIGARMRGFRPELVFHQLEVLDPVDHRVILRFGQMRTGLNLKQLVLDGHFQPASISIIGANISVRREVDGEIRIIGLDANAETPRWLFEDGLFEVLQSDVEWQDLKLAGAKQEFSNVDIKLKNDGDAHKVAIELGLPESLGRSLSIRMDYIGDIFVANCCSGQLYVEGIKVAYGEVFKDLAIDGYSVRRGHGDFKLWSRWKDSRVISIGGEIDARQTRISHSIPRGSSLKDFVDLSQLAGRFLWVEENSGWRLNINRFKLNVSDSPWPVSAYTLEYDASNSRFSGIASYLRLDDLQQFLHGLSILQPDLEQTLHTIEPRGELFSSHFDYRKQTNELRGSYLCTRFHNFAANAWNGLPSVARLDGEICGDYKRGQLELKGGGSQLNFAPTFRFPFAFNYLAGRINWALEDDVFSVSSQSILANTPYLETQTRFKLDIPESDPIPFLDIQVDFRNGVGPNLYRYIPVTVLSKPLVDWLDQAVIGGILGSGRALLRGPLMAFPYRDSSGVFEVVMDAQNIDLRFHNRWPHLTGDSAHLLFHQAGAEIHSDTASILNVPLKSVTASAVDFDFDDYFIVEGNADGSIAQTLSIIRNSPLRNRFEPLLELVKVSGRNHVEMDVKIPMAKHLNDVLVGGKADLRRTELDVFDLSLNGVKGRLKFDQNGVSANEIYGSFLEKPAKIKVMDLDDKLDIQIDGTADSSTINKKYPNQIWQYMQGVADFRLDVKLPKDTNRLFADINWTSDMKGMELKYPSPLGKESSVVRPLQLKTYLAEGQKIPLEIKYSDLAQAEFQYFNSDRGIELESGRIALGKASLPMKPHAGVALNASLPSADIGSWLNLAIGQSDVSTQPSQGYLRSLDIQVDKLLWGRKNFGSAGLSLRKTGDRWSGLLRGEYAQGQLKFDHGSKTELNFDLDYIKIPPITSTEQESEETYLNINPSTIPRVILKSRSLIWDGIDYGRLELSTSRQSVGLQIDKLDLVAANCEIRASGRWTGLNSSALTALSGQVSIADLGLFLTRAGKSNVFNETPVDSHFVLKWDGTPFDFSAESIVGDASVSFGKGRLLSVEPGIGRLFGIFNLDALKSLLLLDFRHLFGKGLAFDKVQSNFDIANGHAKIKDFLIDAIPARITLSGDVNLIDKKLDQIVTVVPKGVVAFGASVLLNQQLPGTSIDGLISREYRVTGNWDNPNITRLTEGHDLSRISDWSQSSDQP